jgi:hypothetical protein
MKNHDSIELIERLKEFDYKQQYDEIISDITNYLEDEAEEVVKQNIDDLYIRRGFAWYNKKEYFKAIEDYNKVINLYKGRYLALAHYNRGFALIGQRNYKDAINDLNNSFNLNPEVYIRAYLYIAIIHRITGKTDDAIEYFNKATKIKKNYTDAYYYRGLTYKENNRNLIESKIDFEKYLALTHGNIDNWTKHANYHLQELNERLADKELDDIANCIFDIKSELKIEEGNISHYSSLTVAKSLFLDKTRFRISEGNFMNDPTEGTELLRFLDCRFSTTNIEDEFFSKPFIGSFVKDQNNLNMWRFYGKEDGAEAMGCSITIKLKEFIYDIQNSLILKEENISDINFYRVAYIEKDYSKVIIPNLSSEKTVKIFDSLNELKTKVCNYKGENMISIEKYLNTITFLFKSDDYKNEDEVRLVVQGVEFEKKYNKNITPPKVYIELETIDKIVEQITLGPRVDKASEWATAFHYCFEGNAPKIVLSHLPYK